MTIVLLVLRDAPNPNIRKSDLYFGLIRQHLAAGLSVHVTSLTPMSLQDAEAVRATGAVPLTAQMVGADPWIKGLRGFQRRLRRKPLRPSEWMADTRALDYIKRHIDPAIVVGIQAYQSGMMARRIAQALEKPYGTLEDISCYRQGRPLAYDDATFRQFFAESFATVCVSNGVLEAICDRFEITIAQSHIIANPVPQGFELQADHAPEGLDDFRAGRFLFAGWTNWRGVKNPDLLIRAFAQVHARYPETALFMAGPCPDTVPALIAQFGLQDSVKLAGNLSRKDVWRLAHVCDCCCLSSDFETFGLSMIEALAAGRPVVATRTDGPQDVLSDDVFGVLSDIGDVDQFATGMKRIYENRATINPALIATRAMALYGEAALSKRWQNIYSTLPK